MNAMFSGMRSGRPGINLPRVRECKRLVQSAQSPISDRLGLVMILREVTDERDRDEVQHDRVDNFVRSKPCFQDSRNGAPECAGQYGSRKAEWN
jgi:hypothetical protein